MADSKAQAIGIKDTLDEHGGIIREITAISLEDDTVSPEKLASGATAHDSEGNAIAGTLKPSGAVLNVEHRIVGALTRPGKIVGQLTAPPQVVGTISRYPTKEVSYPGPYIVSPTFDDQVLDTDQKLMQSDITVKAIAVSRTSNLSGGITVFIGGLE